MDRRRAVVGAVLLLLSAVIVVQVLDPQFGERTPPEVDFSEPPNEVAADAAKQFEYVDYAYRIDFRRNQSDEWRQVRTMRVDHSDREYYKTGPAGERGVVLYGTDAVTFVRPTENSSWRATFLRDVLYQPKSIGQPFLIDRIRSSEATIESQDEETIVLRLDVHPLNVAQHHPGNSVLHIDRDTGLIVSATVSYGEAPARSHRLRFRLMETDTEVRRPNDIPPSPMEVIWDVLRGPVVNL